MKLSWSDFWKLSWFLEGFLIEHIDMKVRPDSRLKLHCICSDRIHSEKRLFSKTVKRSETSNRKLQGCWANSDDRANLDDFLGKKLGINFRYNSYFFLKF